MPRRAPKRKPSWAAKRRSRASREYVQVPLARAPSKKMGRIGRSYAMSAGARCALLYAKSLVDPSGDDSKGACLPMGFPMPSQKIRAFARGTFSTGVSGDGFINWTPTLANDQILSSYTKNDSVGNAGTAFNAFTNLATPITMTKLPYTIAQLTTQAAVQGRFVSGCLRVRYAGNENVRSGIVSLFEDPDHLATTTASANSISLFDSCGKERVFGDGRWHQINWSGPCKMAETEYISTGAYSANCIVIAINGTLNGSGVPGPATFEYEIWQNLEYLGRDVVGKTENHMDDKLSNDVIAETKKLQSQSDPLNPVNAGNKVINKVFAPKAGGTVVGNSIQAGMDALHPGLGVVWRGIRGGFNRAFNRPRK